MKSNNEKQSENNGEERKKKKRNEMAPQATWRVNGAQHRVHQAHRNIYSEKKMTK